MDDLIFKVGANIEGFRAAMADVGSSLNSAVSQAEKSFSGFDKLGGVLMGVGTDLTAAITLPILAAGGASLKFAADFDGAMRQVTSLVGNVAQKDFNDLRDQVIDLATSMGINAVDASHALYEAISANIPKENAIDFLRVASGTAIAGVTETKVAVDGLTTVINAYGLKATEAGRLSDEMFQAVNIGKVTFPELAASIGVAASQAHNLGISHTELLGTMAAITLQGRTSSEAFTEIQSAMKALVSPNKEMNELLKETGFKTGEALISSKGLVGALQELQKAAHGNNQELVDGFGRIEGYNAMLHVTGDSAAIAAHALDAMAQSEGATSRAQAEIEQGATRMWERFKNDVVNTAIALGDDLLPAFKAVLETTRSLIPYVQDTVKWFTELPVGVQAAAIGLLGLAAAMGPVLLIGGQMLQTFASVSTSVTLLGPVLKSLSLDWTTAGASMAGDFIGPLAKGEAALVSFRSTVGLLGQAAVVASAAFAAWELGKWLEKNVPLMHQFSESLADWYLKIPGMADAINRWTGATDAQNRATEDATFVLALMEQRLRDAGIQIDKTGKSTAEYTAEVQKAIKGVADHTHVSDDLLKSLLAIVPAQQKHTASAAENAKIHEELEKVLAATKKQIGELTEAQKLGFDVTDQMTAAQDRLRNAELALHPELTMHIVALKDAERASRDSLEALDEHKIAIDHNRDSFEMLIESFSKGPQALAALNGPILTSAVSTELMNLQLTDMTRIMSDVPEYAHKAKDALYDINTALGSVPVDEYNAAFKTLGLKQHENLQIMVDDAWAAYHRINDDAVSTFEEKRLALERALLRERDAYVRSGEEIPAALQIQLAKMAQQERDYQDNSVHAWETMFKSIHASFDGMWSSFNRDLVTGNWGDFQNAGIKAAENVALAFETKLFKPIEDRITGKLTDLLMDLAQKIPGLSGLGSIGMGPTTPGINGMPIPGLGGGGVDLGGIPGVDGAPGIDLGTGGGGGSSLSSSLSSFGSVFNMFTGAVSAVTGVLSLFGVGQGGEKDRLSGIKNDTGFLAWAFSPAGGGRDAILDTRNVLTGGISGNLARIADDITGIRWPVEQMRDLILNKSTSGLTGSAATSGGFSTEELDWIVQHTDQLNEVRDSRAVSASEYFAVTEIGLLQNLVAQGTLLLEDNRSLSQGDREFYAAHTDQIEGDAGKILSMNEYFALTGIGHLQNLVAITTHIGEELNAASALSHEDQAWIVQHTDQVNELADSRALSASEYFALTSIGHLQNLIAIGGQVYDKLADIKTQLAVMATARPPLTINIQQMIGDQAWAKYLAGLIQGQLSLQGA